jgi:lysophospholipase L1-like esterase
MKTSAKLILSLLFVSFTTTAGFAFREHAALLDHFEFQGQEYSIRDQLPRSTAGLTLQGRTSLDLSTGMKGENILLGTRIGNGNFYVFWLNYHRKAIRLAYYDHRLGRSRMLPLAGFSFIGLPEIVEENDSLLGLVFLGNRSHNDDIFYYEPKKNLLTALTDTPFSEKGFQLLNRDGRLEIEARSLRAQYRYRFDPRSRTSTLEETTRFPYRQRQGAAEVPSPDYYNTYIGFGDSITWGEIEGEQHIESCYLGQMRDLLADPGYADYYGASSFINLGVPGDSTLDGADRIDRNLNESAGFYFLLMLGVNDIIHPSFSLDSSLENLGYIIDAAKSHGMRVIASTLTPSKAHFSAYAYYWDNLYALSDGIKALAQKKNVACIDPLTAFMNTNPPDGWKDLLEPVILNVSSGNHPNAEGHKLIASLFSPVLVKFPPLPPESVSVIDPASTLKRTASWNPNYESDFDHFHVEFGFLPGELDYFLDTAASYCTFNFFPFLPQVYFRLQTFDRGGRQSDFVTQEATPASSGPITKKIK